MRKPRRRSRKKPKTGHDVPERGLIARILDTPQLAQIVPRLSPDMLHRVIRTCGLEDSAELVAMATSEQLQRVFDADLWRANQPGLDEQFDVDRFGVWLDVLMESGPAVAAQKIAGMDADLVIAALAQHLRVFDIGAVSSFETADGELIDSRRRRDAVDCEIGGYLVEAQRSSAWDSIVSLLLALDADHPEYFHRVMGGCRRLSNAGFEVDGLHDLLAGRDQDMFDLVVDREQRRDRQGYVTPAQARAFLHSARQVDLIGTAQPPNPIARAYFRAIDRTPPAEAPMPTVSGLLPAAGGSPDSEADSADAVAAFVELLQDAGVIAPPPRLLHDGRDEELAIHTHLLLVFERDPIAHATRLEELAYLANTLLAGCSIQARPFTQHEASEAALAVCNLGLEHWPRHWPFETSTGSPATERPADRPALLDLDLIRVFQVGWTVLYRDVCVFATKRVIDVLRDLRCGDREIQHGLDTLRMELTKHARAGTPWGARDALDAIAILDLPAWAALLGLIDECPVLHAGLGARTAGTRAVSASAFTFISNPRQIASVRTFLQSLPDILTS